MGPIGHPRDRRESRDTGLTVGRPPRESQARKTEKLADKNTARAPKPAGRHRCPPKAGITSRLKNLFAEKRLGAEIQRRGGHAAFGRGQWNITRVRLAKNCVPTTMIARR
jgi:hypothetical protein